VPWPRSRSAPSGRVRSLQESKPAVPKATGQPNGVDPELATAALQVAERAIPADGRDEMPFAAVVRSAEDASPGTRFVNWMGRG
jgi:hypothetical protein